MKGKREDARKRGERETLNRRLIGVKKKKSNNLDVRGRLRSNNGEEQERKGGN